MTDLYMQRRLGSLWPVDDAGRIALEESVGVGEAVKVTVTKPRNGRFHRLFFSLLNLVAENTDYTTDQLLHLVKIGIGHVDWVMLDGKQVPVPKSISFAKMDDTEFRKFFNRALDFICQKVIPGTNKGDLEREVFAMLGLPS